jgi:putative SOS response-associated peptidase YedK
VPRVSAECLFGCRLALILKPKDYDCWLTTDDREDPRLPLDLLYPLDSDEIKIFTANPAVGNWRNNGPEMLNKRICRPV